jgi:hypothetical protein
MKTPPPEKPEVDPAVQRVIDRSVPDFPPVPWRRRLLVAVLAVAMAWLVVTTMIDPPGNIKRNPPPRVDAPTCVEGQTQRCVGGTARVIVAVPPAAAPASR